MFGFVRGVLRRLRRDERGNVFILFGASAIPLMLILGGAVDIARYTRYKTELSNAVDSAALALARQHHDYSDDQAKTFVTNYVAAFGLSDDKFTIGEIKVTKLTNGFRLEADGTMKTIFLPLGKFTGNDNSAITEMNMDIVSEVVNSSNRLEVALVLDVTGSMNCGDTVSSSCTNDWETPSSSSRIVALRAAANTLVNTLMTSDVSDPDMIKIGVVPFEGTVNIGSTYAASPPSWVDWNNTASAYWNGRNFAKYDFSTGATCTTGANCVYVGHKWLFDQLHSANSTVSWAGCVEMRNSPYDILDTTPTSATPDTLFVPFFWPDEPDRYGSSAPNQYTTSPDTRYNSNYKTGYSATSTSSYDNYTYHNNYLGDKSAVAAATTRPATAQAYVTKYKYTSSTNKAVWHSGELTAATSFPYSQGPNRGCPQGIVPLTNVKSTITGLLSNLVAYPAMGTFIPNGLVWGWHILSHNEPFTQGVGSGDEYYNTTVKAIVLFTDGENSVTAASNQNQSYFSGYGYVSEGRLGTTTSASTATDNLDTKTASLCTNIKNDGDDGNKIRVYTITFGDISTSSYNLMENCATLDKGERLHYHAPSTTDLEGIFKAIGEDLSEIHLSM